MKLATAFSSVCNCLEQSLSCEHLHIAWCKHGKYSRFGRAFQFIEFRTCNSTLAWMADFLTWSLLPWIGNKVHVYSNGGLVVMAVQDQMGLPMHRLPQPALWSRSNALQISRTMRVTAEASNRKPFDQDWKFRNHVSFDYELILKCFGWSAQNRGELLKGWSSLKDPHGNARCFEAIDYNCNIGGGKTLLLLKLTLYVTVKSF